MLYMKFPKLIPAHYSHLIDWDNPKDPLYIMAVPSKKENIKKSHELIDPIADSLHEKTPGLIHRYPDRVLLKVTNACAIHCRFCFRKSILDENTFDLEKAVKYLSKHKEVWEVILSGGDPLMLSDKKIEEILKTISEIPHIKTIRIHTRIPVVEPRRITKNFIKMISKFSNSKESPRTSARTSANSITHKKIIFVFHINHPREITKELAKISHLLSSKNIMLLSRTHTNWRKTVLSPPARPINRHVPFCSSAP